MIFASAAGPPAHEHSSGISESGLLLVCPGPKRGFLVVC